MRPRVLRLLLLPIFFAIAMVPATRAQSRCDSELKAMNSRVKELLQAETVTTVATSHRS